MSLRISGICPMNGRGRISARWQPPERRNNHRWTQGQPIEHPWSIELFGYPLGLRLDDIGWLLADAPARATENERRLAINTAMRLWRDADSPTDLLQRIEKVAELDPVMRNAYQLWLNPPPVPAEQVDQERKYKEIRERHEAEQGERDRSWLEFIDRLRKNPDELREIRPPTPEGVDARLHHLWLLLCETVDASTR